MVPAPVSNSLLGNKKRVAAVKFLIVDVDGGDGEDAHRIESFSLGVETNECGCGAHGSAIVSSTERAEDDSARSRAAARHRCR